MSLTIRTRDRPFPGAAGRAGIVLERQARQSASAGSQAQALRRASARSKASEDPIFIDFFQELRADRNLNKLARLLANVEFLQSLHTQQPGGRVASTSASEVKRPAAERQSCAAIRNCASCAARLRRSHVMAPGRPRPLSTRPVSPCSSDRTPAHFRSPRRSAPASHREAPAHPPPSPPHGIPQAAHVRWRMGGEQDRVRVVCRLLIAAVPRILRPASMRATSAWPEMGLRTRVKASPPELRVRHARRHSRSAAGAARSPTGWANDAVYHGHREVAHQRVHLLAGMGQGQRLGSAGCDLRCKAKLLDLRRQRLAHEVPPAGCAQRSRGVSLPPAFSGLPVVGGSLAWPSHITTTFPAPGVQSSSLRRTARQTPGKHGYVTANLTIH